MPPHVSNIDTKHGSLPNKAVSIIKVGTGKHYAYLDSDQASDILCMSFMRLHVPEHDAGLSSVWLAEGIHHSARKVGPMIVGLHVCKVHK